MALANLIVLCLTLLALVWYAFDTHRLANLEHKKYNSPIITHAIEAILVPKTYDDSERDDHFRYTSINLSLFNYSPYDVKIKVFLNIFVNGFNFEFKNDSDRQAYQGKKHWFLGPKGIGFKGHFDFNDEMLVEAGQPSVINELQYGRSNDIIELELHYTTEHKFSRVSYPSLKYRYRMKFIELDSEDELLLVPLVYEESKHFGR